MMALNTAASGSSAGVTSSVEIAALGFDYEFQRNGCFRAEAVSRS
jgi:hypothetical protein